MPENVHDYELVLIANAQLDDEALSALNERVSGWITASGGTAPETKVWGRRQLAYAIGKNTDVATHANAEAVRTASDQVLDKIERQLRKVHDKRIFTQRREAQRDPPKRRETY